MLRTVGAVIAGYVAMAILLSVIFLVAFMLMGPEHAFKPGVYEVSRRWLALSLPVSFLAALAGGYLCVLIARNEKAPLALCGLVIVFGALALAFENPAADTRPTQRAADVPRLEAMRNSRQPMWVMALMPVIGVIGIMLGSRVGRPHTNKEHE